jgi:hypothetical protein
MDIRRRLQPRGARPKRTQHCAVLEFAPSSWLVCTGLEIKMIRLVPKAERLAEHGGYLQLRVYKAYKVFA